MFFTTRVDNKDPERRWKMLHSCQVFLEIDKKWHFLWCHIINSNSKSIVQDSMCLRVAGHSEFSESSWVQAGLHGDSGGMFGDGVGADGHGNQLWSRLSWVQARLHFCNCYMAMLLVVAMMVVIIDKWKVSFCSWQQLVQGMNKLNCSGDFVNFSFPWLEQKSYFLMSFSIFAVTTCGSWSWHTSFPWSQCATPTPGNVWLLRDGQGRLAPHKQPTCLDRVPFQDQNDYLDLLFWYSLVLMIISPVSTV